MKEKGFFNNSNVWSNIKDISFREFMLNADISDDFLADRNFFENSKKNYLCYPRPPETKRKNVLQYKMKECDDPFKVTIDNVITLSMSIRVSRNLFFYKSIQDIMRKLFEAGLMNSAFSSTTQFSDLLKKITVYEKQQEYSTLTWDQLYPGFYIWIVAVFMCLIVFIGEIIVHHIYK